MNYITEFRKNQAGDGVEPYCPYCHTRYPDGCYGEAKNYPDDGRVAIFMECENCNEEAQAIFRWANSTI